MLSQSSGDFKSHQTGNWNATSTWEKWDGSTWITPAPNTPNNNSGVIRIQNSHLITVTATVTGDQVVVDSGGSVLINTGRTLTIAGSGIGLSVAGNVSVSGTLNMINSTTVVSSGGILVRQQGSSINSSSSTLEFLNGATLEHRLASPSTALSAATFDSGSTLLIDGFTGGGSLNSINWSVPLGNVIYDCPNQASGSVNFAGLLSTIQGNLDIRNTGTTGRIYFNSSDTSSLATSSAITISGHLSITGISRVFLTSSSTVETYVAGDFIFDPAGEAGTSQCATTGTGILQVGGNSIMRTGTWDFSSGANGVGTLNFNGDVTTLGSVLTKTGGSAAQGNINFNGATGSQTFDPSGVATTSVNVAINNAAGVKLSNSLLLAGTLTLSKGNLFLDGVSLTLNGSVIQTGGSITSDTSGLATLKIGGSGLLPDDLSIIDGSIFDTFELNRSSAVLITSSNFVIGHTLAVYAGTFTSQGTVLFKGTSSLLGSGIKTFNNVSVDSKGSLISAGSLSITGNLTNNGSINFTAGSVTFDGTTASMDGTPISTSFFTATISSGATVTCDIPFVVTSTFSVNGLLTTNSGFSVSGDLNVSATGAVTANQFPSRVAGTLTVSSGGTFIANAGADATFSGNLSVNGTFVSLATAVFEGTTAMTGTGSKTFKDIILTGELTPNASYTITGNFILSGNGALNPGNNTTTFGGLNSVFSNVSEGLASFNRITVSAGNKFTAMSFFTCKGTFTARGTFLSNAGFIALGALRVSATTGSFTASNVPFSISGTLTVSSSGVFTANPDADMTLLGNLSVTGTFGSLGTTTFAGKTVMTGSGSKTFNTVIITGTLTPNAAYKIMGNLTVPGTLDAGTNTTTFDGNTTLSGGGSISFNHIQINSSMKLTSSPGSITIEGNVVNNGTFDPNQGMVSLIGNSSKTISSTILSTVPMDFNNIILEGGISDPDLVAEVDINLYGVLTLKSGATFDADGAINNRVFTLRSTGDNPASDASIDVMPVGATISGKITVQRYMSGEGRIYRYICSPVQGASVATWQNSFPITGTFTDPSNPGVICDKLVKPSSASLFYYNESTRAFIAYPSSGLASANLLEVGRGYAAFIRRCTDFTLVSSQGTMVNGVNMGNVSLPVANTGIGSDYNNLVGNPYPSAIDWDSVALTNISTTIAVRDNGTGVFQYYTLGGGGATDIPNGIIAQGQAFWIRSTGQDPVLAINENAKSVSPPSSGNIFYRQREPDRLEIVLTGSTQTQSDKAYVVLAQGAAASGEVDDIDAPKMNNQLDDPFVELFDLYTSVSSTGKPLAINALPSIDCNTQIQLSVKDSKLGTYDFVFKKSGALSNLTLFLVDRLLGKTIEIGEPARYSFSIENDTASKSLSRFKLFFGEKPVELGLPVDVSAIVCGDDSAKVRLLNTQSGMRYFVQVRNRTVSDTLTGQNSFIQFTIPPAELEVGENMIAIKVIDNCGSYTLDQSAIVQKFSLSPASVISNSHCQAGSVKLRALGTPVGGTYYWYRSIRDTVPLFRGAEFTTPFLRKTMTYYVSTVDSLGYCPGTRVQAAATIINYDDAAITQIDEITLQSNFASGNNWFVNGQLLPDTTSMIKVRESGIYKLEVKIGNCSTADERAIVVDGLLEKMPGLSAYPNPVAGLFSIEIPEEKNQPAEVSILRMDGVWVGTLKLNSDGDRRKGQFDFGPCSAGLYYLRIVFADRITILKIIKK